MSKGGKPKLTRASLNSNQIFFDEDVPEHLRRHVNSALDLGGITHLSHDDEGVWYTFADENIDKLHKEEANDPTNRYIQRVLGIQQQAYELDEKQRPERPWDHFFFSNFFQPLRTSWLPANTDSRSVSRQKYFYDGFECDGDRPWTTFQTIKNKNGFKAEDRQGLSAPKPDMAFFFSIHDLKKKLEPKPNRDAPRLRWKWRHTPLEGFIESFSLDVLESLNERGLEYSPFRPVPNGDSYRLADLQCFPWLVVEHKHGSVNNADINFCYNQAANASAAALMLLRSAAFYAQEEKASSQVPPVFAITTIGKDVKIWIAWYENLSGLERYRIAPIYEVNVTKIQDIVVFETILENVHTWATRFLKPLLSTYIDLWRRSDDLVTTVENTIKETIKAEHRRSSIRQKKSLERMIKGLLAGQTKDLLTQLELDDQASD